MVYLVEPGDSPQNLTATNITNTSAILKWAGPATPNGRIRGYCIQVRSVNINMTVGAVNQATVMGLVPYTRYVISVRAFTVAGDGPAASVTIRTLIGSKSSLYVCLFIHVWCVYLCMCVCVCVYMYMCVCMCICVCVCVCVHVYVCFPNCKCCNFSITSLLLRISIHTAIPPCLLLKIQLPSFYYGIRGSPHLCTPRTRISRCVFLDSENVPAEDGPICVPKSSAPRYLSHRCKSLVEKSHTRITFLVHYDTSCVIINNM